MLIKVLGLLNVPDLERGVQRARGEDVSSRRMEQQRSDSALVPIRLRRRVAGGTAQAHCGLARWRIGFIGRDAPQINVAVLGARNHYILVERVELCFDDRRFVA